VKKQTLFTSMDHTTSREDLEGEIRRMRKELDAVVQLTNNAYSPSQTRASSVAIDAVNDLSKDVRVCMNAIEHCINMVVYALCFFVFIIILACAIGYTYHVRNTITQTTEIRHSTHAESTPIVLMSSLSTIEEGDEHCVMSDDSSGCSTGSGIDNDNESVHQVSPAAPGSPGSKEVSPSSSSRSRGTSPTFDDQKRVSSSPRGSGMQTILASPSRH